MRIDQALQQTDGIDSEDPRRDVQLLLQEVLSCDRSYLFTWPEKQLSQEEQQAFLALCESRRSGQPIAHILGRRAFWTFELQVNASTLIPRPETELLVETALTLFDSGPISVVDLGTGTGAVALALATERPNWQIVGTDRVAEAVQLAQTNAAQMEINNIQFVQGDWFGPLQQRFDLILSNPPYIDPLDHHLKQGDLRFEPKSALVADQSGRADLEQLIEHSPDFLNPEGWLLLEHGYDQGVWVKERLLDRGFVNLSQQKDIGGQVRVSFGQWKGEQHAR